MGCWERQQVTCLTNPRRSCRVKRGCDLLILFLRSKDRSLVSLDSSYKGGVVSAEFAAEVEFYEASHFSGFEPGA
jgi:hypothetical protein